MQRKRELSRKFFLLRFRGLAGPASSVPCAALLVPTRLQRVRKGNKNQQRKTVSLLQITGDNSRFSPIRVTVALTLTEAQSTPQVCGTKAVIKATE